LAATKAATPSSPVSTSRCRSCCFSAHLLANPIIEVQAGTAQAQWWSITPATRLRDGKQQAYWMLGSYDDRLVRQDGRWLFSAVNFRISFRLARRSTRSCR
jgi:hypothetical protein